MREYSVDGVRDRRIHRVTRLVAGAEHEVVDEQLGSSVEQLTECLLTVVRVEAVLLLHPHPRQLASLPRELVAEPSVLLFAGKELLTCCEPFLAGSNLVIIHCAPFLFVGSSITRSLSSGPPATIGCSKYQNEQPLVAYSRRRRRWLLSASNERSCSRRRSGSSGQCCPSPSTSPAGSATRLRSTCAPAARRHLTGESTARPEPGSS